MNPYEWLKLYGDEFISQYDSKGAASMGPHCYGLAAMSHEHLRRDDKKCV